MVLPASTSTGFGQSFASMALRYFVEFDIDYWQIEGVDPAELHRHAVHAWEYSISLQISVADSWFLACAVYYDAELWLSHDHEDQFVQNARKIHRNVFTLLEHTFRL